ncbi:MAG: hypothetical protein WC302_00695 [Candidatus Paceibacterota bacterium]|jgi:actin-related protein
MEKVTKEELLAAAKALNETGLSTIKVKTVAIKEEDLKILFIKACEAVPEDKEDQLPDDPICNVYNGLIAEGEAAEAEKKKAEKSKAKEKPESGKKDKAKDAAPASAKKPAKEKKEKASVSERSEKKFGKFKVAADLFKEGKSEAVIVAKVAKGLMDDGRDEAAASYRAKEIYKIVKTILG